MRNRVAAAGHTIHQNAEQNARMSLFPRIQHVFDWWYKCQIGHRSEYSVERLLSFRDYYQQTSLARAIAVCIFTPIPALTVALAIDCIPLKPPSEGWQANDTLWIRMFATVFFVSIGFILQMTEVVTASTISKFGALTMIVGSAGCYTLGTLLLAATWKFPVPFGYVLMVTPYVFFFSFFTVLVIGPRVLMNSPVLRKQILSHLQIVATHGIVGVAYPVFSAIFKHLSSPQQTAFIFVLPMIKFASKQIIANAAKDLHENVGPSVVFSVDVFNVYYIVICMQAATSTITTVIIIMTDSFHVIIALRDIFRHSNIRQARDQFGPPTTKLSPHASVHFLQDLPGMIHQLFRETPKAKSHLHRIRVGAPLPLPLSDESAAFLTEVRECVQHITKSNEKKRDGDSSWAGKPQKGPGQVKQFQGAGAIKPHQIAPVAMSGPPALDSIAPLASSTPKRKCGSAHPSTNFASELTGPATIEAVWEALQALFHSEFVLMAEYIEFVLPMLYGLYLTALFHLPVAKFYPHAESLTPGMLESKVIDIMAFAAVEFAAFVGLLTVMWRKMGYSPLYQLAFVLETQSSMAHGHLIVWNLYILHLTLKHYGTV